MTAICAPVTAAPTRLEALGLALATSVETVIEQRMLRRSGLRTRPVRATRDSVDAHARSAEIAFGLLPR